MGTIEIIGNRAYIKFTDGREVSVGFTQALGQIVITSLNGSITIEPKAENQITVTIKD